MSATPKPRALRLSLAVAMKSLAIAIVAALTLLLRAGPGHAADIGFCAAPDAMTAALKAEGQRSVASAQMITPDKRLFGMIFTVNADRSVGYILRADQPLGDRAGQICVYNRMTNVRLFDARKPGLDPAALLKAPDADAARRCAEIEAAGKVWKGGCVPLNTALRRIEPSGQRVVLQGLTVAKSPDGQHRPDGTLATVTANASARLKDGDRNPVDGILGDILYSSLPDGATVLNATLVYVEYTPYGLSLL